MLYEHGERAAQHGFAADLPELLGQIAAGAGSAPGGDNNNGNVRHAVSAPEWALCLAHESKKSLPPDLIRGGEGGSDGTGNLIIPPASEFDSRGISPGLLG
jgi:hypothetical protein